MALAAKRDARMDGSEFRLWIEGRPAHERWELLDGEPVLLAPPRERHQRIVMNLAGRLDALAEPRGCRAMPGLAVLPIVYSDEARVEVWRRAGDDWSVAALGPGGTVSLPELDGAVPVRDLYRGLAF